MELSKYHNPYDFANPVLDADLFVGRKDEMEEISYYLDHARTAPRAINIALLGPRASGKTSILNMCQIESKKRNFCVVRIDLDEGSVATELSFFLKIFNNILSSVCDMGAFEGKSGKTYDVYLDIVNSYDIPTDKTFCPFLFPLQFAKAMSSGNNNVALIDDNFKSDLITIHNEINIPIILLFDECNVLSEKRILLQQIRNIFMNTVGYMLVFTGTPDLFPAMDEVFSPIIRQFKKIFISGFKDEQSTKECVIKPLEKIGINPADIFEFETLRDITEIHDLSGGRPYEIQLLCHMLFRRVQNRRAKKMILDLSVLEDVRRELEASTDITSRPILQKIRRLKKSQLSSLKLLTACEGKASFEQIWIMQFIFHGEKKTTKQALLEDLEYFCNENILQDENSIITFKGDDFDKIYAKYLAREQSVSLDLNGLPFDFYWDFSLRSYLRGRDKDDMPYANTAFIGYPGETNIEDINEKIKKVNLGKVMLNDVPFLIPQLYFLMLNYRQSKYISVLNVTVVLPWINFQTALCDEYPGADINEIISKIKKLEENIVKCSGSLKINEIELSIIPFDLLIKQIETSDDEWLKDFIADKHAEKMADTYLKKKNIEEALFHADLFYRFSNCLNATNCNNVGYLFMNKGDTDKAKQLFKKSIEHYSEPYETALPIYNIAMIEAKTGNYDNSLKNLAQVIELAQNVHKKKRTMACLTVPKIIDELLVFEEECEEPDLLNVAIAAQKTLFTLKK